MSKLPLAMAFLAALLFGAATPASKALLQALPTFQLAGVLYLGAALGVLPLIFHKRTFSWPWSWDRKTSLRLIGAISMGGVLGPVLLLFGLKLAASASVSLWLNLELIATVLLGYLFFKDEIHIYGWVATVGMLAAALLLSVTGGCATVQAGVLVTLACFCWGLDNHFTALINGITPAETTLWKGFVAGMVNLTLGMNVEPYSATLPLTAMAVSVGIFSYGISIMLYITSAQKLGATRSQLVFSSAPLFGVILAALFLGETISLPQTVAALIIIISLAVLSFEHHSHRHHHEATVHNHWHRHDDGHHDHLHPEMAARVYHNHSHQHSALAHAHPHWPDPGHRHAHSKG
jgi:drug/metabolite transporter (DMT)-like permease